MVSNSDVICALKAVILVAGKGTRLYPVTKLVPKPLLPVANRMTLEYAFDQLKFLGIQDICLVVGESEDYIRDVLGDGFDYGVRLSYVRQEEQLGLADAVRSARDFVGMSPFVLYLGDAIYSGNFVDAAKKFIEGEIDNLNLVKWVEDPKRFGVVELDGDDIIGIEEKPLEPRSNYAMAGLYFFRSRIWEVLDNLRPSKRGEYEITDAIKALIDEGCSVKAEKYDGNWFDTGTLGSFIEANEYVVGKRCLIDPSAKVEGELGESVIVGDGAVVECDYIERSVILPGSKVCVKGKIFNSLIYGNVNEGSSVVDKILTGETVV